MWPTAVQLHTKLYGSKEELEKTATFIYCRDTRFCRQQEQTCGQQQSSYTPNSTAARRNWRRRPHSYTAEIPVSADSKNKRVANSSPATHQTLRQQGGTGEDGHIHILQRYPFLQTARTNVWPTAVQLHTKLYGSKEELEKTATFIYCRDTRFCRQQEQTCGQQQSSYTPNSTAARRNWRRRPHSYTAEIPVSADSKNKRVANSSPATHQTLRQQGGTGEDGHIHILQRYPFLQTARTKQKQNNNNNNKQTKNCAQQQSNYTPNSVAAGRKWRRRPHSSFTLDSQCKRQWRKRKHVDLIYQRHPQSSSITPFIVLCQNVSRFVPGPGQICRPFIQFYFNNNKNSNEIFVKRKPISPTTTKSPPPPITTTTKQKKKS